MTDVAMRVPRGPARPDERALAPDLARGVMLLMIVLANTPWYLYGREAGLSTIHPRDGTVADQATQLLIMTFIDSRVYPMFAFLFGYGMVQLYTRQVEAGLPVRTARRLLQKRNLWLFVFGAVHAALLWFGDVLGAYGLAGLIMVAIFFKRRDQTLMIWFAVLAGLLLSGIVVALAAAPFAVRVPVSAGAESFLASSADIAGIESYPASIVGRLAFWPFLVLFQGVLTLVIPAVLLAGFWAARRRVLEEPGRHLPLLRRVALVGLSVGWGFGLLHGLDHLGLLGVPPQLFWVFMVTQSASGLLGGLGYVALFGLLGHRIATRRAAPSRLTVAVTAVGKRSLSCYLAQSVICAPLLAAWGLDWVAGSAARRPPCWPSASGCSPSCSRTPRTGRVGVVRPRCCCAGWSTAEPGHSPLSARATARRSQRRRFGGCRPPGPRRTESQVGDRGDGERGAEQVQGDQTESAAPGCTGRCR